MSGNFAFNHITERDIEDMLYQIGAYADRFEAKRFHKLSFERKQKVTVVLRWREWAARKSGLHIDKDIVREVITDAQNDLYFTTY